jgi:hypothetical protein
MSEALVWFLLAWALLLHPSGRMSHRLERLWLTLFLIWMPGETLVVNVAYLLTLGDFRYLGRVASDIALSLSQHEHLGIRIYRLG